MKAPALHFSLPRARVAGEPEGLKGGKPADELMLQKKTASFREKNFTT
ncbi:MAG: hypothetical protein LBG98_01450 [Puniceicoccales bacterium]|jgi:hypothetical protein|nr:hypothetical protein [Puniceicoccales bacterium]